VFTDVPGDALAFHRAPGLNDAEIEAALVTIRHRVQQLQVRHGLEPVDDATGPADWLAEESPVLAEIVGDSVQGRWRWATARGLGCGSAMRATLQA